MRQPEMSKIGCLWVENGKPCERPLIGTAWKFCPKHGPLAKLARQREDSRNFREDNSEQYKLIEYRYNHGLTKSQLEPLVVRAEAQREQYPRFMDEFFEQTITRINEIQQTLLYPPADFDSAFVAAEIQANDLLAKLKGKHYSRPSLVTNRLLICVMELLRDIAHPLSPEAFRTIRKYARQVQMRCKEEGDLLKLALSLLVDVEFARLHFLDNPDQVNVLTGAACTWGS